MNAHDLLFLIGVKTLILTIAAVLAWGVLHCSRCRSPQVHRLTWGVVLLLGVLGSGFSVAIPVTVQKPISPEPAPERVDFAFTQPAPVSPTMLDSIPAYEPGDQPLVIASDPIVKPLPQTQPETEFSGDLPPLPMPVEASESGHVATTAVSVPIELQQPVSEPQNWNRVIGAVCLFWMAGIVISVLSRVVMQLRLWRQIGRFAPVDGEALRIWDTLLAENRIRSNRLAFFLTDQLGPGLVWRTTGAAVLVPRDLWDEATPEIREGILRHELAHYRNGDLLRSGIAWTLGLLHWFNPISWFVLRKMDEAAEWICDITAFGNSPDGTLRLAESMVAVHETRPTILINRNAFDGGVISRRLRYLQNHLTQPKESNMKKLILFAVVLLVFILGVCRFHFVPLIAEEKSETPAAAASDTESPGIAVVLTGPDGEPCISGYARTYPHPRPADWEGDQPRNFDLVEGQCFVPLSNFDELTSFKILFYPDGYAPYEMRWPDISREPLPREITFRMPEKAAEPIGGVIVDENGNPVAGASVEFGVSLSGRQQNPDIFANYAQWIKTDENGHWVYKVLPQEQFTQNFDMAVEHPDHPRFRIHEGQMFSDYAQKDADGNFTKRTILPAGRTLRGKVVDENGRPVEDVLVYTDAKRDDRGRCVQTRTDENGEFVFENCAPVADLGNVDVGVCPENFAPDLVTFKEITPDMKPLEFVLKPGRKLAIKAVDKQGNPISGLAVMCGNWRGRCSNNMFKFFDNEERDFDVTWTDENGLFVWNHAPEDDFSLEINGWRKRDYQNKAFRPKELKFGDEEIVLTFLPLVEVTGIVTDAQTGEPIPEFEIFECFTFKGHSGLTQNFGSDQGRDGKFTKATCGRMGEMDKYALRIIADGYEIMTSDSIDPETEKITLNFPLEKAKNDLSSRLSGTVLLPDGKPAANVVIGISTPAQSIQTQSGHLLNTGIRGPLKTDPEGKFSISRTTAGVGDDHYKMIFLHDSGTRTMDKAEFESHQGPITLEAWARIEGTILVGDTPGMNLPVWYSPGDDRDWTQGKASIHHYIRDLSCDENGRFVIERAFPNMESSVGRGILMNGKKSQTGFFMQKITLEPGEAFRATFGGGGYAVRGKIIIPHDFVEKVDWDFAHIEAKPMVAEHVSIPVLSDEDKAFQAGLNRHLYETIQAEPRRSYNEDEINDIQKQWLQSPEGQAYIATDPEAYERIQKVSRHLVEYNEKQKSARNERRMCNVDEKGHFQLDDLTPGTWSLEVTLNWPSKPGQWWDYADVWKTTTVIQVAEPPEDIPERTVEISQPLMLGFDLSQRKGPER